MDWLLVAVIASGAYWIGLIRGFRGGTRYGRDQEKLERRIDEVTETVRL